MASKKTRTTGTRTETLVVQSKLRELIRHSKMNCASDVIPECNRLITDWVARGVERARANGRKTLRATDL